MTRHTSNYQELKKFVGDKEYRKELENTHNKYGFISTNIYRKKLGMWEEGCRYMPNLMTNDGRDRIHAVSYTLTTLSGNAGFNFMGVTSNATAPAATDTTLTAEITTNGLTRVAVATVTHTTGTNSTVMDHTYTATGSFTAVIKVGLFNLVAAGVMGHEGLISSTDLASGDKLENIYTLNLA